MMVTRHVQMPFPASPLPYWRPLCFALGILINVLFLRTTPLQAATVVVTNVNDSGPGSLRQTIADAAAGDTIAFDSTLSGQIIVLSTSLTLTQNLTITGSTVPIPITLSGNRMVRVMAIDPGVKATITNLVIADGRSTQGGGLYNQGTTTLKNVQFYHNQATDGGGIYNLHQLTIEDGTFRKNQARAGNLWSGYGGGIANYHHLTIRNSSFYHNQANIGGGIYDTGTVTITHGDFAHNIAVHGGGLSGVQFISNSTFSQNSAVESGGALSIANATVYNSSFIANKAKSGGAIHYQGVLRLVNSTLTRNQATYGGGVYNGGSMFPTGELWLYNSTLLGNMDQNGGGLAITNSFHLYNTLIAHSLGADCHGTPTTIVNSLIEDGSCSATLTGAPRVGPLLYRPGVPPTYLLLSDSPAIDAGDPATCQTADQAGNQRPIDGNGDTVAVCDIGAFERQPLTTTPEIYLQGNEQWIGNGDSTPDHADQTDFGQTGRAHEMITRTFVISNVGLVDLAGITVTISGSQAHAFRVTTPPTAQLTAGQSSALQLTFSSPELDVRQAMVEVYSDNQPSPLYTFAIAARDCRDRLTVTSQADTGPGSLRQALDDLCVGGVITFADTLAGQTIALEEQLTIAKKLTLDGATLESALTLSGRNEVRVLTVGPGVAATVKRLIIANGRAPDGYGGGIYNVGNLTVTHSTIMNNFSPGYSTDMRYPPNAMGGGIYNGGQLAVHNSTFSGNMTEQSSGINGGGAIFSVFGTTGALTITNSTFSNNGAHMGSSIIGPALLYNTIIAGGSRGGDCWNNQWISSTNTLIEDGSCGATLSGDPLLGPLADNGGGILTQALLPGSPALDAGDNATCLTTDQRGMARPVDGNKDGRAVCDIGAYEAPPTNQPGDGNSDGLVDAGDITACVLEIFDDDGTDPANAAGGSFPGTAGCDANLDDTIDAADLTCTALIIFEGAGACLRAE